ncbi:Signal recognition particle core component, partial [Entomortierella chlamydospora]
MTLFFWPVLKLNPKDKDALHCKAITLIRLERYADALSILNRQLEGKFVFESAYCLYRTNQLAEGARLIENRRQELQSSGNGTLSWNLRHLEAQMLYRMERYQDCIERYAGMLKDTPKTDDSYNDILTNFNACKAAVLYAGESLDDRWKVEDVAQTTYELSFNSACARIAKGDYTQALTLLDEAKQICRETLNDYDEEEIEQEMAIIVVQTAYVHQLLGHVEQARELYHSVLKIKALEVTVPAVAANNLVAIQKEEDLFDSHKKIKTATTKALGYAAIRPESVAIQFAIVQLQLLDGQDYTAAIESLTRFLKKLPQKEQHRPGYVALLVWLYNQAGQGEKGVDLLSEASAVWAKDSKNATMPSTLLRQTAAFKLRSHRYKDAAKDYEELVRADPSDPAAIAGLIMAYSEFEPALAEKYGASLPEMRNVMALDVDSLEKVVPGLKREYVSTKSGAAAGVTGSRRRPGLRPRRSGARKPNKRKPLLPKNLDPAQKGHPDPERWLPKRDRAAARLTRTRKTGAGSKREMGKGPQGMNMEGGGIGGTGSARIAGREHLTPAPVAAVVEPVKAEEPVDVAAIAKAKSSGSNANKKKKSKGKGK